MPKKEFSGLTPDVAALKKFGFCEREGGWEYSAAILGGQFEVRISVRGDGVFTQTVDLATGDEYFLHHVPNAGGEFVGQVRKEYSALLKDLRESCFPVNPFGEVGAELLKYALEKYGDSPEFLWEDLDAAVLRRKDTKKWYAVFMKISRSKLCPGEGMVDLVDVRFDSVLLPSKTDGARFFAGYHMNKKHWLTALLDGSVPAAELFALLDDSYSSAK